MSFFELDLLELMRLDTDDAVTALIARIEHRRKRDLNIVVANVKLSDKNGVNLSRAEGSKPVGFQYSCRSGEL